MGTNLSKDQEALIAKREYLLDAAKSFYTAQNYDMLPEIYLQIAEISEKLNQPEIAAKFIQLTEKLLSEVNKSKEISGTLPQDVSIELEEPGIISTDFSTSPTSAPPVSEPPSKPSIIDSPLDELVAQKRIKQGNPLDSGIVPTVVRSIKEILFEILSEKLPVLPEAIKRDGIEKLLDRPPGPERNAFFKVFLIKNKKYADLNYQLITDKLNEKKEWFEEISKKELKGTIGFFDPFVIIESMPYRDIENLLNELNIPVITNMKENLVLEFYKSIQEFYQSSKELREQYSNPIQYLGHLLYSRAQLTAYFENYDFISKSELMEIFIDSLADQEIHVYDSSKVEANSNWDLFLTKKTLGSKTGVVNFLRGYDIETEYDNIIVKLGYGTELSDWIYFVTTPIGVMKIGLERLIQDMSYIGAWLYIVDPVRGVIYNLLKGKNSSNKNKEKEQEMLNKLKTPLRGIDTHIKFSKYTLDDRFQNKPKNYVLFGKNEYPPSKVELDSAKADQDNLQYLLFLKKDAGVTLDFIQWTEESLDKDLLSGFISAIESFGSSFSDSKGLEGIQYRGFTITFSDTTYLKACLFLKHTPSPRLKELLAFGVKKWETLFEYQITNFKGDLSAFKKAHTESVHLFNKIFLGSS